MLKGKLCCNASHIKGASMTCIVAFGELLWLFVIVLWVLHFVDPSKSPYYSTLISEKKFILVISFSHILT